MPWSTTTAQFCMEFKGITWFCPTQHCHQLKLVVSDIGERKITMPTEKLFIWVLRFRVSMNAFIYLHHQTSFVIFGLNSISTCKLVFLKYVHVRGPNLLPKPALLFRSLHFYCSSTFEMRYLFVEERRVSICNLIGSLVCGICSFIKWGYGHVHKRDGIGWKGRCKDAPNGDDNICLQGILKDQNDHLITFLSVLFCLLI